MPRKFFVDIETLPPGEEARVRVAAEVTRELAGQENAISEAELEGLIEERFRGLALEAERGRVLAIGIIVEDESGVVYHGVLGRDRSTGMFHADEAKTLRSFWKLTRDFDSRKDLFIGHNILDFDLQFLCKRSVVNRVMPSVDVCFARFRRRPVFDTMWEWGHWRKAVGLATLADALEIASPKAGGMDGGKVYDCFLAGAHEEIALYCMRDVECVREIYYRLNFVEPPPITPYAEKAALRAGGAGQSVGPCLAAV